MKRAKQFAVLAYVAYELCEGEDSASISKLQKEANKLAEMSGDGGEKVALSRLAKSMGDEHGVEQWAAQDVNVLTMDEDVFDLLFMKSNWPGNVAGKEWFEWDEGQNIEIKGESMGQEQQDVQMDGDLVEQ